MVETETKNLRLLDDEEAIGHLLGASESGLSKVKRLFGVNW